MLHCGGVYSWVDDDVNWTQPICVGCFRMRNPGREPVRCIDAEDERCCHCGNRTYYGIYIRVDPRTVPYPAEDKP